MPPRAPSRRCARRAPARFACLVALAVLALGSTAHAVTLVSPSGDPGVAKYQAWANSGAMPTPTGVVDLVLQTCPVPISDGCVVQGAPPTIYLGGTVRSRATLLHEIGHAFDAQRLTDADRAGFEAILGDPRRWPSPPNSPHEQFAEAYSLCARHPQIRAAYTAAYAYRVSPAQHRRVCTLIRRAGARPATGLAPAQLTG